MFEFQWDALRVGDHVVVHDDVDLRYPTHPATVALVNSRRHGANDVAFRLDDDSSTILRPRRHAVHLAPVDRRFECWRCDVDSEEAGAVTAITP